MAAYLQAQGLRVIPVNPRAGVTEILGERVYATLAEAPVHESIDLAHCFRSSDDMSPVAHEAVALGLPAQWMQLGVRHEEAAARATDAGWRMVKDRCLKVDHCVWFAAGGQPT